MVQFQEHLLVVAIWGLLQVPAPILRSEAEIPHRFTRPSSCRPQSLSSSPSGTCDSVVNGFTCKPDISHLWGQYSPFYAVQSEISSNIPPQCNITFAQILSRHGARFPDKKKSKKYGKTVSKIQKNVRSFNGNYQFLEKYHYALGAEQLTAFGVQEMVNSGTAFYERYADLVDQLPKGPFVRASGSQRVIDSANHFTSGFHTAKVTTTPNITDPSYPYDLVVISEARNSNNTLHHGACPAFETHSSSKVAKKATKSILSTFIPPITARLNAALPNAKLTPKQTVHLLDLCPFDTVNSPTGAISPFCALFTPEEWAQYDYYQSVGKYYSYGAGNPLGPSNGIGFVNELIARLTDKLVVDGGSVNATLDADEATFPLGRGIYADFSHDNDITAALFALGVFNDTTPLSVKNMETVEEMSGYSAARTVPFGARVVVEKMVCAGEDGELVRVLVNGRVLPLDLCEGVDEAGRCGLGAFVDMLGVARDGGRWEHCSKGTDGGEDTGLVIGGGGGVEGGDGDDDDDDDDDNGVESAVADSS